MNDDILVTDGSKAIPVKITDSLRETRIECGIE